MFSCRAGEKPSRERDRSGRVVLAGIAACLLLIGHYQSSPAESSPIERPGVDASISEQADSARAANETAAESPVPVLETERFRLPLFFEENVGQTDPEVLFLGKKLGASGRALITRDGFVYQMARLGSPPEKAQSEMEKDRLPPVPGSSSSAPSETKVANVKFKLLDAAGSLETEGLLGSTSHYLIGTPVASEARHFGRLRWKDLYTGVDLVYKERNEAFSYDFEL